MCKLVIWFAMGEKTPVFLIMGIMWKKEYSDLKDRYTAIGRTVQRTRVVASEFRDLNSEPQAKV